MSAGEGPALIAEELRLEQLLRQCGAVDRDERTVLARRRLMNESRDDFLAGSRLPLQKDRRVGGGHTQRPRQDALPRLRSSDHPAVGRERLSLLGERPYPRVDPLGSGPCLRAASFRGGQLFVRHGQCYVVGDVLRRRQVGQGVRVHLPRDEFQLHDLIPRHAADAEDRAVSRSNQRIGDRRLPAREPRRRSPQVSQDRVLLVVGPRTPLVMWQIVAGSGFECHPAGAIEKHQHERVVRQDRLDDLGHAGKHAADVQHLRNRTQQCGRRIGHKRTAGGRRRVPRHPQ